MQLVPVNNQLSLSYKFNRCKSIYANSSTSCRLNKQACVHCEHTWFLITIGLGLIRSDIHFFSVIFSRILSMYTMQTFPSRRTKCINTEPFEADLRFAHHCSVLLSASLISWRHVRNATFIAIPDRTHISCDNGK